ncbi:hypothetical protein HDU67_008613 [Dinochytrium kinnereticum]|nr:hypothetical protein HDU67_008613 [Dinochytrium kinnereticum]
MNRPPRPSDWWFGDHLVKCGGEYLKISEPPPVSKPGKRKAIGGEGVVKKSRKDTKGKRPASDKKSSISEANVSNGPKNQPQNTTNPPSSKISSPQTDQNPSSLIHPIDLVTALKPAQPPTHPVLTSPIETDRRLERPTDGFKKFVVLTDDEDGEEGAAGDDDDDAPLIFSARSVEPVMDLRGSVSGVGSQGSLLVTSRQVVDVDREIVRGVVVCPACGKSVEEVGINEHLDRCLLG